MSRRTLLPALACAALLAAGVPAAAANGCIDRPAAAASAAEALPPARLPGLRYDCLVLAGGQPLRVGRGGPASAPVVLLVHGLGQNAHRDWLGALPALTARFRVVTVDLPGFGESPPPARGYSVDGLSQMLSELLDRVAPRQRVHMVGHSLGAAVSLQLAHRHADQVNRLVLVDVAGILLKPVFVHHIATLRMPRVGIDPLDRLLRLVDSRVNGLSSLLLLGRDDRYDFGPWLMRNPEVRQALFGGLGQTDAAFSLVEHDFTAAIRETFAPTALIWGRDDAIAPLRTGQLLAARLPRARLQVIDGAGHTPMADQPAEFNRLLLAALTGPLPQPAPPPPLLPTQGDVVCRDSTGQRYSGRFDSLLLERCSDVRIERAQIGELVLTASSATLADSSVDSRDVALTATDSQLMATAVRLRGRVAIRADNSLLDLAGVSLQASEKGVELPTPTSRLFLSVSDWLGSDYLGDAHFIWPRP